MPAALLSKHHNSPMSDHLYRLIGSRILLRFKDPDLEHLVSPLLDHLEVRPAQVPTLILNAGRQDGGVYHLTSPAGLVVSCGWAELMPPLVHTFLGYEAPRQQPHFIGLHAAAAAATRGGVLILPGTAGSGK